MFLLLFFWKEIQTFLPEFKNWVQSFGGVLSNYFFLSLENQSEMGFEPVSLVVQIAIQLLDVPKALHELCSANPGTPRFYLNTLALDQPLNKGQPAEVELNRRQWKWVVKINSK